MRCPLATRSLPSWSDDRAGEDVIAAVLPAGDDLVSGGLHIVGQGLVVWRHDDRAFLEAPPRVVGLPRSVEQRLGAGGVIGPPNVLDAGRLVFWAKRDMSAPCPKHQTLRCSHTWSPAGLSVCWATTSQPRLTRVCTAAASFAGSNQPIDHDQLCLDVGIDRLRGQRESTDPEHDLRHLVRAEIADRSGSSNMRPAIAPSHPTARREARIVGAHVVSVLVAGAMLELHIGELLGHFDRLIDLAVGRREDQLGPVLRQVLQDWHGARVFLHILHITRHAWPLSAASIAKRPLLCAQVQP